MMNNGVSSNGRTLLFDSSNTRSSRVMPSMRWKVKIKPFVKIGDTRQAIRFAWFPIETQDGKVVWFERYLCTEKLKYVFKEVSYVTIQVAKKPKWQATEAWSQESTMWNEWHEKI